MTSEADASPVWADALLAAALFAVDPVGLGGVTIKSGPGPGRDRWMSAMQALLPQGAPVRRVPVGTQDDRLLGGLDLSASLSAGRPIVERGVLAACDGGVAILSMAERMENSTGARLASVLDTAEVVIERDGLAMRLPARIGLIALDEGVEPDERAPDALVERLAFRIDLNDFNGRQSLATGLDPDIIGSARDRLARQEPPADSMIEALCMAAELFGIRTIRPPLLALRAAQAHAALAGRDEMTTEDATAGVRLVLAPRALTLPADPADEAEPPPPPPDTPQDAQPEPPGEHEQNTPEDPQSEQVPNADMVLEAIQAALPDGLLDQVNFGAQRQTRSSRRQGSGASTKSSQRGRPVGSRTGALRGGDRLNLPETLRAATPWQRLRTGAPGGPLVRVRQEDFRIRRFVQRQEATTIFLVDASGSSAFQRLAEAKGAVELLLAKAYVSRTRVALIAFRSTGAELLLEPTRSLTRAKRSLAELPGGGGTPLAEGLEMALQVAQAEKGKDRTPLIVILTDGRTNIGRGGAPGRAIAEADALSAARSIGEAGVGAIYIDTSPRAQPNGDRFARVMGAIYAPLPYLEAEAVSALVTGAGGGRR